MLRTRFSPNDATSLFTPRADRPIAGGSGTACFIGQVVTPSASIAVGKFLEVHPATVLGGEAEGAPGAFSSDTSLQVPVYLIGPHLATQGDFLVCRFVDFRWVAERMSAATGGGFTIFGCPCAKIPGTLYLHVKVRSFPNPNVLLAYPATLQRMARPADLEGWSSDLTGWYSTTPFLSTDGSYKFRYWFGCSQGIYFVHMLATLDSPVPHREKNIVMYWSIGHPGNTCGPPQGAAFSLTSGGPTGTTFYLQGISVDGSGPA